MRESKSGWSVVDQRVEDDTSTKRGNPSESRVRERGGDIHELIFDYAEIERDT
jgi:hypothetical protein